MVALCDAVDELYHGGIDRSRLAQWMAAHQFVSGLVEPHPAEVDSDAVLNGIAHDAASNRLFVTGKLWPHVFEVQLTAGR